MILVDFDPESGPRVIWHPDDYEREAEREFPHWYQRVPLWRCLVYDVLYRLTNRTAKLLYPYQKP